MPHCRHAQAARRRAALRHCLLLALVLGPGNAIAGTVGGAVALTSQLIDRGISIAPNKATLQTAGYWLPAPGWSMSASVALQSPSLSRPVAVTAQAARAWMLGDRWQMQAIISILIDPQTENPLKPEVAQEFQTDRPKFEATAKEWSKKFAM